MKGKVFIGIFISLLFIYLSFWKTEWGLLVSGHLLVGLFGTPRIDVNGMASALAEAHYIYLLIMMLLIYFGWWIRAWRWQILASPIKPVSARLSFAALMIGYLGNNVFPLRAGEFMRMYVAGKRGEMALSSSLAVIVVERVLDMLMLMSVFTLSLLFFPLPGFFQKAGLVTLAGTLIFTCFLLLLLFQKQRALTLSGTLLKIVPGKIRLKLLNTISGFSQGLEIFRRSEHYILVIFWTIFMWIIYLLVIYVSLYIYGFIDRTYPVIYNSPLVSSIVLLTITTMGIGIPSAPGAVGTYHGVCLFGIQLFNVSSEIGMSYAILMHLSNFFPMTLVGIYCLFREGMKLAELAGAVKKGVNA